MSEPVRRLSAALLGRYVVEREIGVGGAARVFSAWDVKHQRQVALKVLRPELGASVTAERFDREVRMVAQLRHPNILTLIDSGEVDGNLFYVMPYVSGESLRDVMNGGPPPLADAVRLLRDIVDALAYAHRMGIVHRDIKPENVLVDHRHATVTDFGIARATTADPAQDGRRLTAAGRTLGSPTYMAPEQAAGSADADARADIYAFGVVAYELLAGRLPFDATSAHAMMAAHLTMAPTPIASVAPHVPPALAKLVMRCLEKDPKDRWRSSDELLHELERFASAPASSPAAGSRWRISPMSVAVAVVVVTAVIFGVWGVVAQRAAATDRWAHDVAAPRIRQLLATDSVYAAWRLAQDVEARLPDEDAIADFWPQLAVSVNLFSSPLGANVSVSAPGDTGWVALGRTPLQALRFPRTSARLRLEAVGFATWDSVVDWRTVPTTIQMVRPGGR